MTGSGTAAAYRPGLSTGNPLPRGAAAGSAAIAFEGPKY